MERQEIWKVGYGRQNVYDILERIREKKQISDIRGGEERLINNN